MAYMSSLPMPASISLYFLFYWKPSKYSGLILPTMLEIFKILKTLKIFKIFRLQSRHRSVALLVGVAHDAHQVGRLRWPHHLLRSKSTSIFHLDFQDFFYKYSYLHSHISYLQFYFGLDPQIFSHFILSHLHFILVLSLLPLIWFLKTRGVGD